MEHPLALPDCQHAMLAHSPVGHVSVCPDCSVVHLSLNCVSIRLEIGAFMALADMLTQAQKQLHSTQRQESQCHTSAQVRPIH